jgi:hypothetical protein
MKCEIFILPRSIPCIINTVIGLLELDPKTMLNTMESIKRQVQLH